MPRPDSKRVRAIGSVEADPPLDSAALAAIERGLHGRLRAYRFPREFIERHGEDALQQGLAEYSRARARGTEIENPGGWVVETSFRRAIDTLRHECREAPPGGLEPAPPARADPSSPTEEEALRHLEAEKLATAIRTLSPQQRQALGLYYFEELPTRECARTLGCSEPTFRRRRDAALAVLRERFGVAVPEPGEGLAIEVGLAAWLSLAGARVVPTRGPFEQLIGAADELRGAAAGLVGRGRELALRLPASGGGEGIGAAASGPLGKAAAGACAGALAACALTGVIGPGVGGIDLGAGGGHAMPQAPRRVAAKSAPPATPTPAAIPTKPPAASASSPRARSPQPSGSAAQRTRRATRTATSQFGIESAAGSEPGGLPAPAPAPSASSSGSSPAPSPTKAANAQFGLP